MRNRRLYLERPAAFFATNAWLAHFPSKKSMAAYIGEPPYQTSGGTSSNSNISLFPKELRLILAFEISKK